jgi:hypothetical protein
VIKSDPELLLNTPRLLTKHLYWRKENGLLEGKPLKSLVGGTISTFDLRVKANGTA